MSSFSSQFITACWIAFLLFWAFSALVVHRTAETRAGRWSIVYGAMVVFMYGLVRQFPGLWVRSWPDTAAVDAVADLLAFAGLVVLLWARISIGRNWSGEIVLKEGHEVVTKGPYRSIRHPIYSGLVLLGLGTALFWGTLLGLAFVAAFAAVFWYKSRLEEAFMTEKFPETYPAYRARTKAFIPRVF